MEISCCTPLPRRALVRQAGFRRIVLSATELAALPETECRALARGLAAGGLSCGALNDFCPPSLRLCGPGYSRAAVEEYTGPLARRAQRLGVRVIGIGAPRSRSLPEGFSRALAERQLGESLTAMADVCAPNGLRVLLEPVCGAECNFLTTTTEAFAFLGRLADDRIGLAYDIYHAVMMGEPPEAVEKAAKRIGIVHFAHAENGRRLPNAERLECYSPYFEALRQCGYQGEVALETYLGGEAGLGERLAESRRLLTLLCAEPAAALLVE